MSALKLQTIDYLYRLLVAQTGHLAQKNFRNKVPLFCGKRGGWYRYLNPLEAVCPDRFPSLHSWRTYPQLNTVMHNNAQHLIVTNMLIQWLFSVARCFSLSFVYDS